MSSTPIDRITTTSFTPFEEFGQQSRSGNSDHIPLVRSGEITWSDFQRALWAPPSVQQTESRQTAAVRNRDSYENAARHLPKFDLHGLEKQQDQLEQTVKTALSLHVQSLENKQQGQNKFPHLPVLEAFLSPDCKLAHTILPDGTSKTVKTAPDGSTRTDVRSQDGRKEAKVADRYGRPVLIENLNADGTWSVEEMSYHDSPGKISPFVSSKRTTQSDGTIAEVDYSRHGKVTRRQEYSV